MTRVFFKKLPRNIYDERKGIPLTAPCDFAL
jgi:hypothetical protein